MFEFVALCAPCVEACGKDCFIRGIGYSYDHDSSWCWILGSVALVFVYDGSFGVVYYGFYCWGWGYLYTLRRRGFLFSLSLVYLYLCLYIYIYMRVYAGKIGKSRGETWKRGGKIYSCSRLIGLEYPTVLAVSLSGVMGRGAADVLRCWDAHTYLSIKTENGLLVSVHDAWFRFSVSRVCASAVSYGGNARTDKNQGGKCRG
ncbi:hypothetical protein F4861DRAFT_444697 [Xylaria intraflava]|nr:hypothetical protein F4861DRAFT_444697 [Xylaria intraflava]